MTLKSILIILSMVVVFTAAVIWIAKNGGWDSEKGCHGDCNACKSRCEEQEALKKIRAEKAKKAQEEAERILKEESGR